jgi:hypothetical protein
MQEGHAVYYNYALEDWSALPVYTAHIGSSNLR